MTYTSTMQKQLGAAVHQNAALSKEGLLERLFSRLFHGLVYAQIWEDPVADMEALKITGNDHIVCIASGGCNMMSYLTANPASITAVDLSPAHVALNKLKLAAAQHMPNYGTFFTMFGHADRPENIKYFDNYLAPHLDGATRAFWENYTLRGQRKSMFKRGLYRYGVLGRFIGTVQFIARRAGVDFVPLLTAKTLQEQQEFFDHHIDPIFDTKFIRFLARRRASLFGLGIPPAQYDKLAADYNGDVLPVLRERTRKLFCDFPISENYFAVQAAQRKYLSDKCGAVPPYLDARHFETLQANASRARVVNQSLTDLLAGQPGNSKTIYVMLDAQDWMSDEQLNALWSQITRTAAPGARVLFRTGGTDDILPGRVFGHILNRWHYDEQASRKAFENDRSAIYGGVHLYRFNG